MTGLSAYPELVDSQVHVWEADRPERPWSRDFGQASGRTAAFRRRLAKEEAVTYPKMIEAMDAVGVSAAVLTATSIYGWDDSYLYEARDAHPDRFAVVGRIDPLAPDVVDRVADSRRRDRAVGLRMVLTTPEQQANALSGRDDRYLFAVSRERLAVAIYAPGFLKELAGLLRRFPDLIVMLDHAGMTQPPFEIEDDPFRLLPDLLALAANANVSVKLSALPTLARQPYPYADLWPHIHRIIHAFGAERVMWGSDWTRVVPEHTYRQQADYIRTSSELGPAEKRLVLGAAARRILRWPRG